MPGGWSGRSRFRGLWDRAPKHPHPNPPPSRGREKIVRQALKETPSPLEGQGNRIWRQHVFSPLPSGRGGNPSPRRWEGEGELPPPVFLQATTRKRLVPLTLPPP